MDFSQKEKSGSRLKYLVIRKLTLFFHAPPSSYFFAGRNSGETRFVERSKVV